MAIASMHPAQVSPGFVRETPLPTGRLGYTRKGMVLHAAANAMNHSRNQLAADTLRDLVEEVPTLATAWALLGSAVGRMGDAEGSIALHERAVEIDAHDPSLHSTLIFALDQSGETTLERAYQARRAFNACVRVDPSTILPHENDRTPDRKLRVGYVSGDFRNHSAAYGWGPVLLAHTRNDFELYAYACTPDEDDRTADFQRAVPNWRRAWELDDDALAQQIRDDRIDVLVDLSGHSLGNRLGAFARKPAPVQVTGWGYITGTGLDAMDYLFADDVTVRPDEERHYAEEIVRLPRILTFWTASPKAVGEIQPPPFEKNGYLTFGWFGRVGKIQPQCIRAWAEILTRVPDARLLLKCPGLDDEAAQLQVMTAFALAGAATGRIELRGMTPQNDHIRAFHEVDVSLDTSPHGGGMTTLESVWMGAPVLTLPAAQIVSRIAASVNTELGLDYLIADSWPDYIARAVALDEQRDELRAVRRLLREMMTVSAFGDHARYAQAVESQYRWMWQRWCRGEAPERWRGLRAVS